MTEQLISAETAFSRRAVYGTLAIFSLVFLANEYQLRRHRAGREPFVLGPRAAGNVMALLFYAILIGVNLDPKVRAVQERAFGPRPLGMPVLLFVILLETILYLPAIGVFRHAAIIVHQARLDGASMGKLGIFIYLLRVGKLHPELRHSQRVVVTGCLYLFAVLKTWIAYAAYLGI